MSALALVLLRRLLKLRDFTAQRGDGLLLILHRASRFLGFGLVFGNRFLVAGLELRDLCVVLRTRLIEPRHRRFEIFAVLAYEIGVRGFGFVDLLLEPGAIGSGRVDRGLEFRNLGPQIADHLFLRLQFLRRLAGCRLLACK